MFNTQRPESSPRDSEAFDGGETVECIGYGFGFSRRSFVKMLGGGLLLAVAAPLDAQGSGAQGSGAGESGRRGAGGFFGSGARNVAARIHLGADGTITVMSGKVEGGQGARAELTQAAAEELRVSASQIRMLLADTSLTPDDGMTAGSATTPRTVPAVRRGAAAARELLIAYACDQWKLEGGKLERAALKMQEGRVFDPAGKRSLSYADLGRSAQAAKLFQESVPDDIALTAVKEWKVMGTSVPRPAGREIVTGAHQYPSDLSRPGMLYGKILRAPAYGAKLISIDLAPAKAISGVVVVQDGQFVGVAAPTSFGAGKALAAISATAKWETTPQPSSSEIFEYLRKNAQGGVPPNPFAGMPGAAKTVRRTYHVPYVQHAPLEPRAAVAEWRGGTLTVSTASQNPFGVRRELAAAFHLSEDDVRVIIPDFGGAFGGKHTGECAVEAARLARAAEKPISLRWTREEEFTWAYFRPAAVIDAEASLDARGKIATWYFVNINSGPNAVDTPYAVSKTECRYVPSKPPLRHGSYRCLAATANNFAREVFMDELAAAAGLDPLDFRLANLDNARLRAVLEKAAKEFGWRQRAGKKSPGRSVGLACGTEKGSYVAACVEVSLDRASSQIKVLEVCQSFECGAIVNPENLLSQVQGAVVMGMGPALREEIRFKDGKILNAAFSRYRVPRFSDLPEMKIHLMDRPDLPSAGAGETPIIAIAPAIANAVFRATGTSVRAMPVRLDQA